MFVFNPANEYLNTRHIHKSHPIHNFSTIVSSCTKRAKGELQKSLGGEVKRRQDHMNRSSWFNSTCSASRGPGWIRSFTDKRTEELQGPTRAVLGERMWSWTMTLNWATDEIWILKRIVKFHRGMATGSQGPTLKRSSKSSSKLNQRLLAYYRKKKWKMGV